MSTSVSSTSSVRPIRFGIMCNGHEFAAWEAACIRNLMAVESVGPALLIVDDRPPDEPRKLRDRLPELFNPKTILWRLYQRLALNRRSQSTQRVDLSSELAGVPLLRCRPLQSGRFVQRFVPEDIAAIRQHDLDFIMRFAFNILRGDVLEAARFGVWSFHHGDPDRYRGTPPGFWEIYNGDPVTGTVLQRLTERLDAGVMLHKGYFKTNPASYSRSRDAILFGAADWPARLCRQLQAREDDSLRGSASSTSAPIYRAPNSLQMLRFLWTSGKAWVVDQLGALFRVQQWSVGIIDAPVEQVAGLTDPGSSERLVRSAQWLPEPKGRFLADPFAVAHGTSLTIFAEDYDWQAEVGHVAALRIDDGIIGSPTAIIRSSTHLSYPYILEVEGQLYCVPESSQAEEVALYRATQDRSAWTKAATLISGIPIIDPTIFEHGGLWWLFGTRADAGDNWKLFAWHAKELTGPWKPHSTNPIKTDVRSSRPAGPLFAFDGNLYRPAQDCSTGYGAAVVINRIDALTPDLFEESVVSRVRPDLSGMYPSGLHTICGVGGKTVIDGSRPAFFASLSRRALGRKFQRLLSR